MKEANVENHHPYLRVMSSGDCSDAVLSASIVLVRAWAAPHNSTTSCANLVGNCAAGLLLGLEERKEKRKKKVRPTVGWVAIARFSKIASAT